MALTSNSPTPYDYISEEEKKRRKIKCIIKVIIVIIVSMTACCLIYTLFFKGSKTSVNFGMTEDGLLIIEDL